MGTRAIVVVAVDGMALGCIGVATDGGPDGRPLREIGALIADEAADGGKQPPSTIGGWWHGCTGRRAASDATRW